VSNHINPRQELERRAFLSTSLPTTIATLAMSFDPAICYGKPTFIDAWIMIWYLAA